MKLWTIVDLIRVPNLFQTGIRPRGEEIIFHQTREFMAEQALEDQLSQGPDYLPAFIEVDFPEDDLDSWFSPCMASSYDMLMDDFASIDAMWESGELSEEEYTEGRAELERLQTALDSNDARTALELQDFTCLYRPVPPELIKLLDPSTMLEAVVTGDQQAIIAASQEADVKSLETLGPNFWVWLIMFMAGLFGPEWGAQAEEAEAERKAKKRRKRRTTKKKPKGKKKPARKRRKRTMAGAWA